MSEFSEAVAKAYGAAWQQVAQLKEENAELKLENARLEDRIDDLEMTLEAEYDW